jgi:hypothetical protein
MFQSDETVSVKEFALMLSSRIGKNGLPLKYSQAIRLLDKYGDYTTTNDNPNYKVREVKKERALEILALLNVPKKGGRQ